jgi:hypothetical protein
VRQPKIGLRGVLLGGQQTLGHRQHTDSDVVQIGIHHAMAAIDAGRTDFPIAHPGDYSGQDNSAQSQADARNQQPLPQSHAIASGY